MSEPADSNPVPGIRAVFLAGFLMSEASSLLYLAITGHFWESVSPYLFFLIVALLGIGLVGTWIGSISGLSGRLLLGQQKANAGWLAPVVVAGATSSATGLVISRFLVAAFWPN